MCERYYLIAVLISISLTASGIEHLFIGLLALCVSSDIFFGKMSTQILCPFCNWVVFYYWVVKILGTFWMLDPPWSDNVICECFLQFGGLSFCSLDDLECRLSVFLLFCFFLIICAFGVLSKKPLPNPKSQMFPSNSFSSLALSV